MDYQYETIEVVGTGSLGDVHMVTNVTTAVNFVRKKFDCLQSDETTTKVFEQLKLITHDNLVRLHDVRKHGEKVEIFMEFCAQGNLQSFLSKRNGKQLPESKVWIILFQLSSGLEHLHGNGIAHEDIKSTNVLLSADSVKLSDFGLRKLLVDCGAISSDPHFPVNDLFKFDILTLACIVYEMCALKPAFVSRNAIRRMITQPNPLSEIYSEKLRNLVFQMMSIDPSERPTASQIAKIAKEEKFKCPFSYDCTEFVNVSELNRHKDACEYVSVSCNYCVQSFPRKYLQNVHLNKRTPKCTRFMAPCQFCHTGLFDRMSLATHSLTCNEWTMQCGFHQMGCSEEGDCEHMTEHYRTAGRTHWKMMKAFFKMYGNKIKIMSRILEAIKSEIAYKQHAVPAQPMDAQQQEVEQRAAVAENAVHNLLDNEEDVPLLSIERIISECMVSRNSRKPYHQIKSPKRLSNCIVCEMLLIDAYQIECGYHICKLCHDVIKSKVGQSLRCPKQCGDITTSNVWPDTSKRQDVQDEIIWCPHSFPCEKLIRVSELQRHFEIQCPYAAVSCKYCGKFFMRKFLRDVHLNKCNPKCVRFKGPCSFCQTEGFDQLSLEIHSRTCADWKHQCEFHQIGCEFEGNAQQLEAHSVAAVEVHMYLKGIVEARKSKTARHSSVTPFITSVTGRVDMSDIWQPNLNNCLVLDALVEGLAECNARAWPDGRFILEVPKFQEKITRAVSESEYRIVSEKFYSQGYKMRMIIHPNGREAGQGNSLAVGVQFCVGYFDDSVKWPVNLAVRIEVFNTQGPQNNISDTIPAVSAGREWKRPTVGAENPVLWLPTNLPLADVQRTFLHNDSLLLTCQCVDD